MAGEFNALESTLVSQVPGEEEELLKPDVISGADVQSGMQTVDATSSPDLKATMMGQETLVPPGLNDIQQESSAQPFASPIKPGSRESLFGQEATQANMPLEQKPHPLIQLGIDSAPNITRKEDQVRIFEIQKAKSELENKIKSTTAQIAAGKLNLQELPEGKIIIEEPILSSLDDPFVISNRITIKNPTPAQIEAALKDDLNQYSEYELELSKLQPAEEALAPPALPTVQQVAEDPNVIRQQAQNIQNNANSVQYRNDAIDEYRAAVAQERDALADVSLIEADKNANMSQILASETQRLEEKQKLMQEAAKQRKVDLDESLAQIDEYVTKFEQQKIDPNRIMNENKFGNIFAIVLGQLGAGLMQMGGAGPQRNVALDILNRRIDQDIAAQKYEAMKAERIIGMRKNIYNDLLERYQDEDKADAAMEVLYSRILQSKVNQMTAQSSSESSVANGQKLIAQLKQKEIEGVTKLDEIAHRRSVENMNARAQMLKANAQLLKEQGKLSPQAPPSAQGSMKKVYERVPEKQQATAIKELGMVEARNALISQVKEKFERYKGEQFTGMIPFSQSKARADALATDVFTGLIAIAGKQTSDKELQNIMALKPTAWDTDDAVQEKLESMIKIIDRSVKIPVLRGFGIIDDKFNPTIQPAGIPVQTRLGEPTIRTPQQSQLQRNDELPSMTNIAGDNSTQFATNILQRIRGTPESSIEDLFSKESHRSGQSMLLTSGISSEQKREFIKYAEIASKKHNIPSSLLLSLANTESGFNTDAISRSGAAGPYQFIDSTAKNYGLNKGKKEIEKQWTFSGSDGKQYRAVIYKDDDRMNVMKSTDAAARYLKDLINMFDGNVGYALMAYNAGPGAVKKALGNKK